MGFRSPLTERSRDLSPIGVTYESLIAAFATFGSVADGAVLVPVNTSVVEYLPPATERRVTASARMVRAGRRLANLRATL